MGTCTIHFNQIEIINKKSDNAHSDNDWMIVHWFTNSGLKQSHTFPLTNTAGSTILNSGQLLQPFSLQLACADGEFVTAVFQIVNLGSIEAGKQAGAVAQIAQKGAEAFARVYLEAVQFVVANSGLPLASVFADGIKELTPVIIDSVGAAFEDVIIPAISGLADIISGILGRPNCNGDVLHDIAVFEPSEPWPPVSASKVYTASALSGCSRAKTAVTMTLERWLDAVPQFPPGPPPKLETSPGTGISGDAWLGIWGEDAYTAVPRITIKISRSLAASGAYRVEVQESIDPRFDAKFEAEKDVITLKDATLQPVGDDVFGTVRPWTAQPFVPRRLQPMLVPVADIEDDEAATLAGTQLLRTTYVSNEKGMVVSAPVQATIRFGLQWAPPINPPRPDPPAAVVPIDLAHAVVEAGGGFLFAYEAVPIFDLSEFGVYLGLYSFKHDREIIGYGVRYLRDQNWSYTRADVMLTKWKPLG